MLRSTLQVALCFSFALVNVDSFLCPSPALDVSRRPASRRCDSAASRTRMMLFSSADVQKEAWAWSHTERNEESKILKLTAEIEAQGGRDQARGLVNERRKLLHQLIQHDYTAYVRAATALGGLVDRNDLPNVQDIPYEGRTRKQPQSRALDRAAYDAELFPSCSLPNVTYTESLLDKALLSIFRKLVEKETGFQSEKEVRGGISDVQREGCEDRRREESGDRELDQGEKEEQQETGGAGHSWPARARKGISSSSGSDGGGTEPNGVQHASR
eukprot:751643-Hanusia_phi.AAC.1